MLLEQRANRRCSSLSDGCRGLASTMMEVQKLRLTHPALDFWMDVRLREFDGRWLAVADLAGDSDVGGGDMPSEALWHALWSLR
jgi:hypothetical protein